MLKYLDGYPLELPCRYLNKYACFTKIYIISNIPLAGQYTHVYEDSYESYLAFIRRIHSVQEFKDGKVITYDIEQDTKGWRQVLRNESPFTEDATA